MFRLMQPKMPPRVDASLPISTVGALHSGKRHHALLVVKLASLSSCLLSFSLAVMWYRHFSPGPWCLSLQPRSTAHVPLRSILALASYVHFLFVIHSLKSLVEIYKTLIQAFNLYEICILITLKHVSIPHTLNVVTELRCLCRVRLTFIRIPHAGDKNEVNISTASSSIILFYQINLMNGSRKRASVLFSFYLYVYIEFFVTFVWGLQTCFYLYSPRS